MKTQTFKHNITITIIGTIFLALLSTMGFSQQRHSENTYRKSIPAHNNQSEHIKYQKQHKDKNENYKQNAHKQKQNNKPYSHTPTRAHQHYKNNTIVHQTVYCSIKPYPYHSRHKSKQARLIYRHLPKQAVRVVLNDHPYYYFNGQFFAATHHGYYITEPPSIVRHLPHGCSAVWVYGKPMFRYHGIYFSVSPHGFNIYI